MVEREGLEPGAGVSRISNFLNTLGPRVPLNPPESPYLALDLALAERACDSWMSAPHGGRAGTGERKR